MVVPRTTSNNGSGAPLLEPTPSKSRAVVHIGLHKTGTTAFQEALDIAAPSLLDHSIRVMQHHGPFYPDTPASQAFDLANAVIRLDTDAYFRLREPHAFLSSVLEDSKRQVKQDALSAEQLLVASMESLSFISCRQEVERLVEVLAPREVHVVLVLRDRRAYLKSLRSQVLRLGLRPTKTFTDSCLYLEEDSWVVDFDRLIGLLFDVLGESRVHILDYEREIAQEGSVVPALWAAAGLPRTDGFDLLLRRPWVNRTPSSIKIDDGIDLDAISDADVLRSLANQARLEVLAMRTSRSWRVTSPLRGLMALLRARGDDRARP